MADNVFGSNKWRDTLTAKEMHDMTDGIPLLIWYAKSLYSMGQLSSESIHNQFNGPDAKLSSYLYDNFIDSFKNPFTQNVIKNAKWYFMKKHRLNISKNTLMLLSMPEDMFKNYQKKDEDEYFRIMREMHLMNICHNGRMVDFSPLLTYFEKSSDEKSGVSQSRMGKT
jgi:hypothetical protein